MPVIQIPFGQSPSNVSVSRGAAARPVQASEPESTPITAEPDPVVDQTETQALQTLATIDRKLQDLDARLREELTAFRGHLMTTATQIAREALGSESELIDQRVTHFAETLLKEMKPDLSAVLFVNPTCIPALRSWLSQTEDAEIEIQGDATVEPGDCRIESNDKGLLASLESFLHEAAKQTPLSRGHL